MSQPEKSPLGDRRQPARSVIAAHERLTILTHPVCLELLARLRDNRSGTTEFHAAASELSTHLLWAASGDLPLQRSTVPGFFGAPVEVQRITSPPAAVVILRAGEVFSAPFRRMFPAAPIFHIGISRDDDTLTHQVYSDHVSANLDGVERVLILDPMLATGGSIILALERVRARFSAAITVVSMVAAPLGVQAVLDADDRVHVLSGALDERLDGNGYILPGLGDAGDRLYGT